VRWIVRDWEDAGLRRRVWDLGFCDFGIEGTGMIPGEWDRHLLEFGVLERSNLETARTWQHGMHDLMILCDLDGAEWF